MASLLRIDGVRFLDKGPIDLTIDAGECVSLSGPSGAGKTLLLRALVDLDPHKGHVFLDGEECGEVEAPLWRRRLGMLPAESQWWADDVGAHFPGDRAALTAPLSEVGLSAETLEWSVSRLSTGERQRLAVVRLLAREPEALLLDEPTANLDEENVGRLERLIEAYRRQHTTPVLWVSHDRRQADRIATRHFVLESGSLRQR